ncbi:MAG: ABC transporter ATP-binding protein [Candidatus Promineifilaceae bacterium]|nr:ABC transporter ATP-binding protein [Candidatus Promineifilaceae bacterium]
MNNKNGRNSSQPIVELNHIVKSFPVGDGEITILHDISLDIHQGEFVSIVGPSGNGKSTLLNMITGIDRPSAGKVIVTGRAVHKMSENELAKWRGRQVGIIFQFFQMLPSLSLLQNVVLPMEFAGKYSRTERRKRALELLDMVDLADQAQKLPGMVSGGQQQRAAIARALATDPPLLIADEPTGNLDAKTAGQVFDLFMRLIDEQGKTMIMVTHDKELAGRIPRKIEIVNGRIAADSRTVPYIQPQSITAEDLVVVEPSSTGILAGLFGGQKMPSFGKLAS